MSWDLLCNNTPSPLQELHHPLFEDYGVRVVVKRDDLLAIRVGNEPFPAFCGNKWRKLKYNLLEAKNTGIKGLATFGGAYSNHIAAVAAAGQIFGFNTIGVIRGEAHTPLNPTLAFATRCGMELQYVDRDTYRTLRAENWQYNSPQLPTDYLLLPEGGTNALSLQGSRELGVELQEQIAPDYCCIACGTGGTLAGLQDGIGNTTTIIGFPVLKNGDFLRQDIAGWLGKSSSESLPNLRLATAYHFGGYGKWNRNLLQFIRDFYAQHGILLDQVYTGKMCFGVFDLLRQSEFTRGSTICIIHTGGLQGAIYPGN